MSISQKVKALLSLTGKKQVDLMAALGMGSKQSMSNKFSHGRWSAEDIVKAAEACGAKVAFILPDGQQIFLDAEEK